MENNKDYEEALSKGFKDGVAATLLEIEPDDETRVYYMSTICAISDDDARAYIKNYELTRHSDI